MIAKFLNKRDATVIVSCKFRDICSHKQPSRGVLLQRCSENMHQIYRKTPMGKCNFNKVAKQATLLISHFGMGVLLWICCIFLEHLFLKTPLVGYLFSSLLGMLTRRKFSSWHAFNILTKARNRLKRAETSQVEPKLATTTQNQPKRCKKHQNFKIGEIWHFLEHSFFKLQAEMPKFGYFGQRSVNFLSF